MYRVCQALVAVMSLLAMSGITLIVTAILRNDGVNEPWGELAGLNFVVMVFSGWGLGVSTEHGWPEKPVRLSRQNRKTLKKERERVELARAIDRLEREVRE